MRNDGDPALPYRVLSLDGGGTWAVIEVMTLIDLFGAEARGHDVLAKFDLAVGNSGGAVILACLAVNQRLSETLTLYTDETKRRSTFQPTPVEWFVGKMGCGKLPFPRYSTRKKLDGLSNHLGLGARVLLSRWKAEHPNLANLVFTAFDYDVERATFFRTNVTSRAGSQSATRPDVRLLDAVHSSTNAPVLFFDHPAIVNLSNEPSRRYWDGAVAGYNNPTMAAVVEALATREEDGPGPSLALSGGGPDLQGKQPRRVQALSIGTGTVHRPRRPENIELSDPRFMGGEPSGLLRDFLKFSSAIGDDPPDAASFVAHVTLGGRLPRNGETITDGPIVRMNPVVRPVFDDGRWVWPRGLGDPNAPEVQKDWARLVNLGMDALAQEDIDLVMRFCAAWFGGGVPNQPIRARDDTLEAEIGHDTHAEAKVAALGVLS